MRIDPAQHDWMTAPQTLAVFAALPQARFVGGAVRNALLGLAVTDIDIAVPMPPDLVIARLKDAGIKVIETGIDHGTVTAIVGRRIFEITSLRRDVATDGRHAQVQFTDDWALDAARRDFTINAMYAALNGEVFDYASGRDDLAVGRVRFMGDAATRIAEDYLRVLRLFRFHAWYGKGDLDADGLRACACAKDKLKSLSAERIAKEMLRLLEAPDPVPVLRVMAATGILSVLLPGTLNLARLARLVQIDVREHFAPDAVLRLAALLPDAAAAQAVADALKLSNVQRTRLEQALDGAVLDAGLPAQQARRLLYRIGAARLRDKVRLAWAGDDHGGGWRLLLDMAAHWQVPRFALTGADVMQAGVAQGPQVGRILAHIEDWWIGTDFTADEAALRARLDEAVRHGV